MREILLLGTESVEEKVLIEHNYTIEPPRRHLALKNMYSYSICYQRKYETDNFNLMAIARRKE